MQCMEFVVLCAVIVCRSSYWQTNRSLWKDTLWLVFFVWIYLHILPASLFSPNAFHPFFLFICFSLSLIFCHSKGSNGFFLLLILVSLLLTVSVCAHACFCVVRALLLLYLQQWGTYSVWNPSRPLMISKAGVVLLTLALTVLQTTALSWLGGHMPVLTGPKRVTVNTSPLNKSQHPLLFTPGCLKCSILFSVSQTGRTDSYECAALSRVQLMLVFKSFVCQRGLAVLSC